MKWTDKIKTYSLLALIIAASLLPLRALAVTTDSKFYAGNDILFYDPNDSCGNATVVQGNSNMPYTLPADSGKTGNEDPIDSSGRLTTTGETVTFHRLASKLSQEYRDYAINMRWNYTSWYWDVPSGNGKINTGVDDAQFAWMEKEARLILVTNPRTGKSIVAAALETGPQPWTGAKGGHGGASINGWKNPQKGTPAQYTGRVSGLTPPAIKALGAEQGMSDGSGDVLTYAWAPDQKAKPGPSSALAAPSNPLVATPNSLGIKESDTLKQIWGLLTQGGFNSTQTAAIMGNIYQDSGFNSDLHEPGNDIGYGLMQWSKDRRIALEAFARQKGVKPSDIPTQIEFLLKEYNDTFKTKLAQSNFAKGTDLAKSTEDWMKVVDQPLQKPANDPAKLNSVRIPAAQAIYNIYSNSANASASNNNCAPSTNNGVVANDIVQTALNFALKTPAKNGMNQASDAEPAFIDAIEKYNPGSDKIADCGGFVGTVMIASKADPDYPGISTATQRDYVKKHTEKYKVIDQPKQSDLQPGDILIVNNGTDHHTQIYTGGSPYPVVDASLGTRVPSVRPDSSLKYMLSHNGTIAARLIK